MAAAAAGVSLPRSRTSVKLIDPATGAEITEPGVPGELYLKGPSLFAGYLDGANLPSPFDEEGYLKTGDMFVIDGPKQTSSCATSTGPRT